MTYAINYIPKNSKDGDRGYTMFDIEYYQKQSYYNDYKSEINCRPEVEGITYFLKDKFNNDNAFDFVQFIKDSNEIEELNTLLNEKYDNSAKYLENSNNFHYHVFGEVVKNLINNFANKYDLFVNID